MASSEPNIASANALANSVFPTPVGPKNMKEPIGLVGSFNPERARRIARATAETASSWPTTRWCRIFSRLTNRSDSFFCSCVTGTPVHCDTTSATSAPVTLISVRTPLSFTGSGVSASLALTPASLVRIVAAVSKSWWSIASSLSATSLANSSWSLSALVSTLALSRRTLAALSSTRSMALSGRKRVVM